MAWKLGEIINILTTAEKLQYHLHISWKWVALQMYAYVHFKPIYLGCLLNPRPFNEQVSQAVVH